jgi:hypothetical protein
LGVGFIFEAIFQGKEIAQNGKMTEKPILCIMET